MNAAVHVCDLVLKSCTFSRSSPSEKLTPSRDAELPFLPFPGRRNPELFCRGAGTQSSQELRGKADV